MTRRLAREVTSFFDLPIRRIWRNDGDDTHWRQGFATTILTSRREAASAAIAGPWIVGSSSLGLARTVAPSDRITYGLIGCGDHGAGWNLDQIFREEDAQVLAVCDVDSGHLQRRKSKVLGHYKSRYGDSYRACDAYSDFRELLERPDLDVIAVCTPDHWHILPAITAIKSGKDVICEKPLSLFVAEGRALCEAVAATHRVFQTASENRSIDSYIRLCRTGAKWTDRPAQARRSQVARRQ